MGSPATWQELSELERQFEDAETEIIRQQYALTDPIYKKRADLVAKITDFWPLAIEQAPTEIDQFIQPQDSRLLMDALTSVYVSHFEIDNGGKGDPRSIAIRMEFAENEHFEDKVIEKKFWFRRAKDGRAGLVSEPVAIKWKTGKDLTEGLLDLAVKVWKEDKKHGLTGEGSMGKKSPKPKDYRQDQKALRARIDHLSRRGVSFFCWFGFRGENISAEENLIAIEEEKKERAENGKEKQDEEEEEKLEDDEDEEVEGEDEEEGDEDDASLALEIFPDGDDLAIAFSEDLWPSALQYFTQAQEKMDITGWASEDDDHHLEDDEEGEEDLDDSDDDEAPPLKRVRAE